MYIANRPVLDGAVTSGPDVGERAAEVTVVLDDLRALAAAVDTTLSETGTGTTTAREGEIPLGDPSDEVAQDLVQLARTAQDVYRESVTYILSSLEQYRDALLAAAERYAATEESITDDLWAFTDRVDTTEQGSTQSEQEAAGGAGTGPSGLVAPGSGAEDGTPTGTGTGTGNEAGTEAEPTGSDDDAGGQGPPPGQGGTA